MGSLVLDRMARAQGMTDIDRRQCERTVPMELLCLGMSRTGTSSLRAALKQIGYNDTYHASCIYLENPRDSEMWVDAYRAKYRDQGKKFGKEEFDKLLGHCMAVTDVPCLHFKEELCEAYPNAKIIITTRDSAEAWLKSVRATLIPWAKRTYAAGLGNAIYRLFEPKFKFQAMNDEMARIWPPERLYSADEADYHNHKQSVHDLAKEKGMEVLEFNVKSGWKPLCEFLGKPIPTDDTGVEVPFPRKNDTGNFKDNQEGLWKLMNFLVGINVACTAVGAAAAVGTGLWAWDRYGRR